MQVDPRDELEALDTELRVAEAIDDRLAAHFKRSLALWAVRWVIGMGLAFAIVVFTGKYQWLPWAAAAVALVSLAVIVIMHRSLARRMSHAKDLPDRIERALDDNDGPNT